MEEVEESIIDIWKEIIQGKDKSWVVFENGTCVILMEPEENLAEQAKNILAEFGPVHAGTPSADFSVITLSTHSGWVVTCHHPDILNYVGEDEEDKTTPDYIIGLLGRGKRDADASTLEVIHVKE